MSNPAQKDTSGGDFLFLSQVTTEVKDRFKGVTVHSHLINTGYKTKKGADKYHLTIYRSSDDEVLAEYPAFQFMSRAGKPYFKVLVKRS